MRPIPWYRAWIYTINILLILFQLIFLTWAYWLLTQPRFEYIPIDFKDVFVITTLIAISIQIFVCLCGIIGVYFSIRPIVKIYWLFMIPLIAFDILAAIVWSIKFHYIHKDFSSFLRNFIVEKVNSENFCFEWRNIHDTLNCCPKLKVRESCPSSWIECHNTFRKSCDKPLLQWMHSEIDPLVAILYFLLTPLKLTVVIILRQDIAELFAEIFYQGHPSLITRQWVSRDSDDEQEIITMSSSRNSRDEESVGSSLLQKHYLKDAKIDLDLGKDQKERQKLSLTYN